MRAVIAAFVQRHVCIGRRAVFPVLHTKQVSFTLTCWAFFIDCLCDCAAEVAAFGDPLIFSVSFLPGQKVMGGLKLRLRPQSPPACSKWVHSKTVGFRGEEGVMDS